MTRRAIPQTWATTERVLVGFDDRSHSLAVLRDAWRLAHGLDGELIALHIEPAGSAAWRRAVMELFKHRANEDVCRIKA